ncbi:thiamine phosphate synthase [Terricaulis silvestris]|uniref:thiamine phosphate synthase n=1 Tax=Terricaulis silvestris TaxID=2686094 RepID=UPI00131AA5CF|nr:thiamine phosphate synthase [Terricaulis silvestris]
MGSPYQLAALARRLNRAAGSPAIPALFFLTDPKRTPDPVAAAKRLPRGTAVVYRHFGATDRAHIARQLAAICRSRALILLIAADPELARRVGAGVHWPETRILARDGPGLIIAAAHNVDAIARAAACGADACILSPVFPTRSKLRREPLGVFRASQLAQRSAIPVIALGGVTAHNARLLAGRGFAGVAAIDALMNA